MLRYYDGASTSALWVVRSAGIDPATGNEIFLKKDGSYTFRQPQPASYDFFFIAIDGVKPIPFAIDSTETVTINSDANSFYDSYTVEGNSESQQIKEMNELQTALEKQINEMLKSTSPAIIKTRNESF